MSSVSIKKFIEAGRKLDANPIPMKNRKVWDPTKNKVVIVTIRKPKRYLVSSKSKWRKPGTSPKESSLEEWCRKYAHDRGWTSRKMNGLGFRSWPDRFFIPPCLSAVKWAKMKGYRNVFWVEFKRLGKPSTPDQKRMQKDLRARGET